MDMTSGKEDGGGRGREEGRGRGRKKKGSPWRKMNRYSLLLCPGREGKEQ
jgi:hypothetical protein